MQIRRNFFSCSKSISLTRDLGYDQLKMYSLVSDIGRYYEFVPGIKRSVILSRTTNALTAELGFGVNNATQYFVSRVHLTPNRQIIAKCDQVHLLFNSLKTIWNFIPISQNATRVILNLDLKFNNPLVAKVSGLILDDSASRIMKCFEDRAYILYGKPKY